MMKKIMFSKEEYIALRNEMTSRISIINSQSNTVLFTIFSAWAAGITLKYEVSAEKIIEQQKQLEFLVLNFIRPLIFLIPIIYLLPLAVKSGENLTQLASISAYIRVFHDYLSSEKDKMNWETSNNILSNANVDKGKKSFWIRFYNNEYTLLAIISLCLYCAYLEISLNLIKPLCSVKCFYSLKVVYIIAGIGAMIIIYGIYRNSSVKNTIMKATPILVEGYIKRAIQLGYINQEEVKNIKEYLNPYKTMHIDRWYH